MEPPPLRWLAFAVAAALSTAGCRKEAELGEPFVTTTLDAALVAAGQAGRVVFVDFGATWCGPCRELAATTLIDGRVRDWLREHTVPLRLDVDEVKPLAKEFRVDSLPTMLFLRPDRTELGRITGYRDVDAFLAEAQQRLQGITALDQARTAVAGAPSDVGKQKQLFSELARAGKHEEALAAAEAYWTASHSDMAEAGVRASFFLSEMHRLADAYGPAHVRMQRWLGDARRRLEAGEETLVSAMELAALARELGQSGEVLGTAVALERQGPRAREAANALAAVAGKELVGDGRYAFVVDNGACEPAVVAEKLANLKMADAMIARMPEERRGVFLRIMRQQAIDSAMPAFEALAGVGRVDDAMAVAKSVFGVDGSAPVREQLLAAARRAGNEELAKRLADGR